jgi:ABC-2 type transport system permease protein
LIGALIKKDLLLKVKNPSGLILLVSLPLVFALLLGLIFSPKKEEGPAVSVRLLIEDQDQSFVSQFLTGAFGRGELSTMFVTTAVDSGVGRAMMDKGKGSALLVIPKGFGKTLLDEKPTELVIVKNPSESFAPKIAEETASVLAEGAGRIIRFVSVPLKAIRNQSESNRHFSNAEIAALSVQIYGMIRQVAPILNPPIIAVKQTTVGQAEAPVPRSILYVYFLAGVSVFCLLFLLEAMARDFIEERENRTLHRQLSASVGISTFVLSKLLFLTAIGLVAHTLVWTTACIGFGIRIPLRQIPLFAGFSLILVFALVGIIGLFYSLVQKRAQAQAAASAVIIFFGLFGGAMIPVENMPAFMRPLTVISPVFWGQDGIKKILIDHTAPNALIIHFIVLGAVAAVFNGLAFLFFNRRLRS